MEAHRQQWPTGLTLSYSLVLFNLAYQALLLRFLSIMISAVQLRFYFKEIFLLARLSKRMFLVQLHYWYRELRCYFSKYILGNRSRS